MRQLLGFDHRQIRLKQCTRRISPFEHGIKVIALGELERLRWQEIGRAHV